MRGDDELRIRDQWEWPVVKVTASRAASSICSIRIRSGRCILHIGGPQHLVTKVPAQTLGRLQVDFVAFKNQRQLVLHRGQREKARCPTRFKLHQDIDIAVWSKIGTEH